MLKRTIKYKDLFTDEPTEGVYYFNLSKPELIEMEVSHMRGFEDHMQAIIDSQDRGRLLAEFKSLILMSYGERSEDGERFVKSEEITLKFTQTAAYQALYLELATDENAAAEFILGVVPKDLSEAVKEQQPLTPPNITPVVPKLTGTDPTTESSPSR